MNCQPKKLWRSRHDVTLIPCSLYGALDRHVKLRVVHALGMPGRFSLPLRDSDFDMHHGTCLTRVPSCMTGSLTSGFLSSRWRGKRSRHSRHMHNPRFYVSGKRPMAEEGLSQREKTLHMQRFLSLAKTLFNRRQLVIIFPKYPPTGRV